MSLAALLGEADALGAGLITWRQEGEHGWFCFASAAPIPHVARGVTGVHALNELVSFLRRTA